MIVLKAEILRRMFQVGLWPNDVLAGWAAGASWRLLCALAMARLQRAVRTEPEADKERVGCLITPRTRPTGSGSGQRVGSNERQAWALACRP